MWISPLESPVVLSHCSRHCFKIQVAINFMGQIVLWTGPHNGCESDVTIWRTTWHHHQFRQGERWLADGVYGGCAGLLVKFKRRPRGKGKGKGRGRGRGRGRGQGAGAALPPVPPPLTQAEKIFNNIHEHVRNRIETVIRKIKDHKMFARGAAFTGSYESLCEVLQVVGHLTALELRMYPYFNGFGPWAH